MRASKPAAYIAGAILALGAALPVSAQLHVEVTSGVTDPVPIAIVPFSHASPADGGLDVAQVIQHDLEGSGRFRALSRGQMPSTPTQPSAVVLADWKNAGEDYIVVGRVVAIEAGNLAVDFDLLNTLTGQRVAGQRFVGTPGALRNAAHRVSDVVYEKIIGIRGAFATRIAYVSVAGEPPQQKFQLIVADADGENQRLVLESRYPLMSPSWSPDGQWLAYVSFENKKSAIWVQLVRTGERRQVSARAGINGSPAYSPDGKKLALTLGGSGGNPDVYVLDLQTQNLTRITDDPAIDTEAVWAPDGKTLYFTSDRAGSPQIYRIGVNPGDRPKRITFTGNYNARPRLSADGTQLAMVTLDNGNYRIAVQDLSSGTMHVLSKGHLDESPSFAPNGATLMYSERDGGHAVLATVSVDGLTGLRLKAEQGEVREPAWGPFAE
ncbi:MAG: Tol-Pal system beta propeller repeat protein TolB [Sinobacteraceae bacterium]|nr:Tol-Pal system beta propeller repeat protein TolB [Nevskiaceae bacterium]